MAAQGPWRIALISSSFFPAVGGVEEHVRAVARSLARRGHVVEVWTVAREGDSRRAEVDGLPIRYMPTPLPARAPAAIVRFGLRFWPAWRQWASAHREFTPDVLHVHCFGPNGAYALAMNVVTRTPMVVTSHGETLGDDDGVYARSVLLRACLRRAIARAAVVTAPSAYVLDDLRRRFGLRGGTIIANGIDKSTVVAARSSTRPYFFAVGRLGAMKGFDLLIRAFAQARLDPSVCLVIGGDGPERDRLEALVVDTSLAERVEFLGWMEAPAVAATMASALGVVVPSRSEAFGIVALEAWRARAALIITSRGGPPEFVRDHVDGLLVDPLDRLELMRALEEVATQERLRESLTAAGHSRVAAYDWTRIADQYEQLYARTIPKSG